MTTFKCLDYFIHKCFSYFPVKTLNLFTMSEADLLLKAATEKAEGYEVNSPDPVVETSEFFVLLISLCVLGLLFVIGIGTNAILLWAFYRRPKLRTISNR